MFTGIIEQMGIIEGIETSGTNISFTIRAEMTSELKPDQSISHGGVCLTVEHIRTGTYTVTAVEETLKKTNLSTWKKGAAVNLERCLQFDGRLDGHIVQGHVDTVAICTGREEKNGSWEFSFSFDKKFTSLIIEKGSVTVNGISLTAFNVSETAFTVAVIPYTYQHTDMQHLRVDDKVNIEFDMIGKYVNRISKYRTV